MSGDTTPCKMTRVTLHSHVRFQEIWVRTCCGPLFSVLSPQTLWTRSFFRTWFQHACYERPGLRGATDAIPSTFEDSLNHRRFPPRLTIPCAFDFRQNEVAHQDPHRGGGPRRFRPKIRSKCRLQRSNLQDCMQGEIRSFTRSHSAQKVYGVRLARTFGRNVTNFQKNKEPETMPVLNVSLQPAARSPLCGQQSSEINTYKTVNVRFWPCLSGEITQNL